MKVMTYNVHSCKDIQGHNSLSRIIELIRAEKPSIVGLNEIETFSPRTWFTHQPKRLAQAREMLFAYGPTVRLGPVGFFGNAILSRYPIHESRNVRLPGSREPRCCLKVRIHTPKGHIIVISTHLGLNRQERTEQIAELARIVKKERQPVVLMGDFNCGTDQLAPLYESLTDTGMLFGDRPTYPFDRPNARIDYILVSPHLNCIDLYTACSEASDHLPVIAELEIAHTFDQ